MGPPGIPPTSSAAACAKLLTVTQDYADLADAEVVFECVVEKLEVKSAVFAQLVVDGENHGVHALLAPLRDDAARLRAMRRAAWGQRTVAEIESGEPFATILEHLAEVKWS